MPKKTKPKLQCAECGLEKSTTAVTPKNPTPLCFECRMKQMMIELKARLEALK